MSEPTPATTTSVAHKAARGAAWTLPTSLATRAIGLVGTLVLARFLSPDEYGEVTAAAIIMGTTMTFTTFGIGNYLVSTRDVTRETYFHASFAMLLLGVLSLPVVLGLGGPLGRMFDAPLVARYLPVFAAAYMLDRVSYLTERVLIRNLSFAWLSVSRGAGEIAFTAVSIGLAAAGLGAMAIAWANLARSLLRNVLLMLVVDRREWLEPHRLRWATFVRMFRFGVVMSISGVASFAMRRWDNLLISRYHGPAAMGAYNYAYNLADMPAVAVGEQLSDVIAASFPHLEDSKAPSAIVRSCTLIALIMFPLAFGLGAIAPTLSRAFFNSKWAGVGEMMVLLSVLSALRPISHVLGAYFISRRRTLTIALCEWAGVAVMVAAIMTVGRINVLWACGAVGIFFVLRALLGIVVLRIQDGVRMSRILLPLLPPLLACAPMVTAVLAAQHYLRGLPPLSLLIIEVVLGALVYSGAAAVVARSATRDLIDVARTVLGRRRA